MRAATGNNLTDQHAQQCHTEGADDDLGYDLSYKYTKLIGLIKSPREGKMLQYNVRHAYMQGSSKLRGLHTFLTGTISVYVLKRALQT